MEVGERLWDSWDTPSLIGAKTLKMMAKETVLLFVLLSILASDWSMQIMLASDWSGDGVWAKTGRRCQ